MKYITELKELNQPNFFQRLLKLRIKENAFIEVNNLFASKPINEIKSEEIEKISSKYKIDLRKKFIARFKELYQIYFKQCITDNLLDNHELAYLNHIKILLMLDDLEVEEIQNQVAGEIYRKKHNEIISKGEISKSEEKFLEELQLNLRLPTIISDKISIENRSKYIQEQYEEMVIDERISPEEWIRFNNICDNLNTEVSFSNSDVIDRLKLYWVIENENLPEQIVPINLQKNECCYFFSKVDWFETKTITKRINYAGPTARFKIMKGVYYRAGSVAVQRITSEELHLIDSGDLYLTNKRIIFIGRKKNSNIQLGKILAINPFSDGVEIEKDTGKSPTFKVENADILAMILGRLINNI